MENSNRAHVNLQWWVWRCSKDCGSPTRCQFML